MPIPSALPISYSQITGEFGGTSLLTAAANAGLPAGAVSFSSFAGKSANEGSGSFLAGYFPDNGTGFSTIYTKFGTYYDLQFPSAVAVQSMYQLSTDMHIRAPMNAYNEDATFHSVTINGVTLNRADAFFNTIGYAQWIWNDVPADTIVDGIAYEPIWRTS